MSVSMIIIAHNIRSTHNVGSLMRTAEGLGIVKLYLTGYTPYPSVPDDGRLPHLSAKLSVQIHKTALGAENCQPWEYVSDVNEILVKLKNEGYIIAGLEQTHDSKRLPGFEPPQKLAIILGSEVTGLDEELRDKIDYYLEIPMAGKKESFNVVEAATMAMYQCMLASKA